MVFELKNLPKYAEFFAGGGMVTAALQDHWSCAFANDIDPMKCAVYRANWGQGTIDERDIRHVPSSVLLQPIDLYWASSPCQDFSLAGKGLGLSGARSGVFLPWIDHVRTAVEASFGPAIIAFENVPGLVSRNKGKDFRFIVESFMKLGYRVGAVQIDARHFLPQSRSRVFVVAIRGDIQTADVSSDQPSGVFHSQQLQNFVAASSNKIKSNWIWWRLPDPKPRNVSLDDIIDVTSSASLYSKPEVNRLIAMMTPRTRDKIKDVQSRKRLTLGTLYKRGRPNGAGEVVQRAEVRFDGIAGCLRTPSGGSSRQTLLIVNGPKIQARLLSKREVFGLMGLPESYAIPDRYNDAYKVAGDGVAVPVVKFLDNNLFRPLLAANRARIAA